jgi:hypothetical protein
VKRPSRSLSYPAVAALLAVAVAGGCSKDITQPAQPQLLTPSSSDANAGQWKMIVLTGPTQIAVGEPAAATSSAYQAEVEAVKAAQGTITDAQRAAVDTWGSGGVLHWNEIMRGLAAHYDLPPAPRPDGTYPAPDVNNPTADPQFPFSNPPYAARAYSYVSVAQYEALKVAWYYKYLYKRPAPAKVDSGVRALVPVSDLPAYPSEDAVLAGVTSELLKAFFPVSAADIDAAAAEQQQAALLSGKATASDLEAGFALGKAVAAVLKARAAGDGMKTAGGTPADTAALAASVTNAGEVAWKSQETPPRPPMLPKFGKVRQWMMTPTDLAAERPGAPPSTSSSQMASELAEVKDAVENITREQLATVYKWADGVSTYSPPGHWNLIAVDYVRAAGFSEVRAARTYALLNMAEHDAAVACWDVKYTYFNPRPSQLDPSIKTVVGLPNFPSYTSGHSTFSAAAAAVLSYVFPSGAAAFDQMKEEAAMSRLYGGIHYRSDIEVGKDHGKRIGGYTIRFAQQDGAD